MSAESSPHTLEIEGMARHRQNNTKSTNKTTKARKREPLTPQGREDSATPSEKSNTNPPLDMEQAKRAMALFKIFSEME